MSLASFGVKRILTWVMMNKAIKSKRNVFMFLDFLLQSALVGNILWVVMFITREVTVRNYLVLLIASIVAGIFSSFIDTSKIFSRGSNIKLPKPENNLSTWMNFYFGFILLYIGLSIIIGIKLF